LLEQSVPPPPDTHHIEPLTLKDNLPRGFPARAFFFQVSAHVHPTGLVVGRSDDSNITVPETGK
jgi:hypothetical protein